MNSPINWSPGVKLEAVEKQVILKTLQFYKNNKTSAANALGISIRTIDNKLEKYSRQDKANQKAAESRQRERELFLARSRGQHVGLPVDNVPIPEMPKAVNNEVK